MESEMTVDERKEFITTLSKVTNLLAPFHLSQPNNNPYWGWVSEIMEDCWRLQDIVNEDIKNMENEMKDLLKYDDLEGLADMLLAYAELTEKIEGLKKEVSTFVATRANLFLAVDLGGNEGHFIPNLSIYERVMKSVHRLPDSYKESLSKISNVFSSERKGLHEADRFIKILNDPQQGK